MDFPTDVVVREVCLIGRGMACCRYLTMSPQGWSCEKRGSLRGLLDRRVETGEMLARGDNCDGLDSR